QNDCQQSSPDQMPAGSRTHRKIDHLGGENEGSHHAQKWNAVVLSFALGTSGYPCHRRRADRVQGAPYRRSQESIGNMHAGSYTFEAVLTFIGNTIGKSVSPVAGIGAVGYSVNEWQLLPGTGCDRRHRSRFVRSGPDEEGD